MAGALLFSSQRVQSQKLEQSGYRFLHPDLVPALTDPALARAESTATIRPR